MRFYFKNDQLKIVYLSLVQSLLTYEIIGRCIVVKCHLKHFKTIQKLLIKLLIQTCNVFKRPKDAIFNESTRHETAILPEQSYKYLQKKHST